jgi:hypothetical protein
MTMTPAASDEKHRVRFSLPACFWFQLLIIPAFLSPVYYHINDRNQPYVVLLAFLIAPTCYASAFACRAALRAVKRHTVAKRSVVFSALRSGALYGLLFGILALGPIGGFAAHDIWTRQPPGAPTAAAVRECLDACLAAGFVLLNYLVIGSAAGAIVGLIVDHLRPRNTGSEDVRRGAT